ILQRYGIDPVTGTPCDVDRLQTTIGNALPGSTYFGITMLVALEHLRLAWARWRPPANGGNSSGERLPAVTAPAEAPPPTETRAARRRARRVPDPVSAPMASAIAVTNPVSGLPDWAVAAMVLSGATLALFVGTQVARGDFARTWVAIPLSLAWGAAVARGVTRNPAVPAGLAVGGWALVIVLSSIANGLTLSRGPQLGLLAAGGLWVLAVATLGSRRLDLRTGLSAAAAFAGAVVITGGSWFIPVVGCRPEGEAPMPAPAPTAVTASEAAAAPAGASLATAAPVSGEGAAAAPTAPVAPSTPVAVSTPVGPSAIDRAVAVVNDRLNFQGSSASAASLGWRTNVWLHALEVYADRPPSVEAKARAMAAALAGAQYGDVAALNRSPGSRAPGGWWYRLVGYGPESQVFTLATSTSADIRAVQGEITYDRAHNVVLDVLLTTGAVGLAAWAVNLGAAFVLAWRLRRGGAVGVATASLAPILLCILVSGLSGVDATAITLINWVVIATCMLVTPEGLVPAPTRRPEVPVASRRPIAPAVVASDEVVPLVMVSGALLAACVAASVFGLGATSPLAWSVGAFVGLAIAGLAVAERPFPRGRPDLRVVTVTVVAALVSTIVMTPGWNAMAAGHYARLTQNSTLPKEQVAAMAKRAVALDPGQATYRVLAGMS
ncbi:MAG: hypothetical protein KGS10_17410, partial [Chloroflexi bacterium]|nr:hypothetical protein [Chloroflexota bacterium]